MTSPPTFSVVIPAYNARTTVRSAILSALRQTHPVLEVIVVDDGSSDGTGELVTAMAEPRVGLVTQANRGLPAARNAGIAHADGSHVAFLDSDDLWLPRYLELAATASRGRQDVGLIYTDAYAFESGTGRVRRRTAMQRQRPPVPAPRDPACLLLELLQRNFIWVSTIVPRAVLDRVGGFDEARTSLEDYAMWLRIVNAGYRAICIPGQQGLYRVHRHQMSRNELRMVVNLVAVLEALNLDEMPTEAHRELLLARRAAARRQLRILRREAPLASAGRELRHLLGRVRKQLRLSDTWYPIAPPDVRDAFPDLSSL